MNTAGNGHTGTGIKKPELQQFSAADLIRELHQFLQHMLQNIILMKYIISILSIAMPEIMANHLPQISILRSISGKLPRKENTGKMANGYIQNLMKYINH